MRRGVRHLQATGEYGVARLQHLLSQGAPALGPAANAIVGRQRISLASGAVDAPVYDRAQLGASAELEGPAIVKQLDATTLLLPGQAAEMHKPGSLVVRER